jgi:hypothetical protein
MGKSQLKENELGETKRGAKYTPWRIWKDHRLGEARKLTVWRQTKILKARGKAAAI